MVNVIDTLFCPIMKQFAAVLGVFFSLASVNGGAQTVAFHEENLPTTAVRFPGNANGTWRSNYSIELLQLALNQVPHKNYRLQTSKVVSPRARNFTLLESQEGIDVLWSMTRKSREKRFRPIRIPIFRGLSGWRIPLIHDSNYDILSKVVSLNELQQLTAGQMQAWTDTKILRANGFQVDSGPSYESMFRMLSARRFDYFPRSIIEALSEANEHRDNNITIDKHIALHYPTAIYYFVSKENAQLAHDIEYGLETLIANGGFNRLFMAYHGDFLQHANIPSRRIFHLENPFLPAATPLNRTELWLDPRSEL